MTQLSLLPPRVSTPSGTGYLVHRGEGWGLVRFDGTRKPIARYPDRTPVDGCTLIVRAEDMEAV